MSETSEEEASQQIWALWRDAAHAPAISILLNSTDFQTIRRAITTLQTKTQNWFLLKKKLGQKYRHSQKNTTLTYHQKMFFLISCCLILFSNNVNAKSVSELEKEALSQFVEVYDLIRYNNKQQAKKIQQLMQKDEDQSKKIELLQLQVTELQKLNAPSTCSQLSKQGIDRDQEIFLDFDGINHGKMPVEVCILHFS